MTMDPLKISGLREFQAALKSMDGESQKKLRLVLNQAAEIVATGARRRMPSRTGRARASVKASSSQREARVKGGGAKAPYYPWLDFGGAVGREKSVKRRYYPDGRFIFPAYSAQQDNIAKLLEARLVELAKESGLDVT